MYSVEFFFFFQAEDGIRDTSVTGVQTCALPIYDPAEDVHQDRFYIFVRDQDFERFGYLLLIGTSADIEKIRRIAAVKFNDVHRRRSEERRVGKECRCRWAPDD